MANSIRILIIMLVVSFTWQLENVQANVLIYKNDTLRYAKAVQCKGKTLKGERCKKMTQNQTGYCWYHNNTPLLFKSLVLDSVELHKYKKETQKRKKKQLKNKMKKKTTK